MAFFPRNLYNPDASFTNLFRLLDDFDTYSRQGQSQTCRRTTLPAWQPKFDVRETGESYHLHGELPGISKEDVHIEFSDPQTMTIRGKTERTYTAGTPPAGLVEDAPAKAAIEEPKNTHQATVEDEYEAVSHEADTEAAEAEEQAEVQEEKAPAKTEKPVDGAKYWLTERSVGEFSRSFNFPTRVEQDAVSASFKDGILNIVVPKAKKHESRRIIVN